MSKKLLIVELDYYLLTFDILNIVEIPEVEPYINWLSNVGAIFKKLDETDYQSYQKLRKHLYSSIPRKTRKHAAEQIKGFLNQKVAEYKKYDFSEDEKVTDGSYISQSIIEAFVNKSNKFSYKKLIRLLNELNISHTAGYPYSSAALIRAVLDHIPPLFNKLLFEDVVNGYSWGKTDLAYMKQLLDFRKEGDDALHRPISEDEDLLDIDSIPGKMRLNRLLQEGLKTSDNANPMKITKKKKKKENIEFTLSDEKVEWANYGVGRFIFSSFKFDLKIDNYSSNRPDYISVSAKAELPNDKVWEGKHFLFEKSKKSDESFKISANGIQEITFFVSDHKAISNTQRQLMPEIKMETLKFIVTARSGKKVMLSATK